MILQNLTDNRLVKGEMLPLRSQVFGSQNTLLTARHTYFM